MMNIHNLIRNALTCLIMILIITGCSNSALKPSVQLLPSTTNSSNPSPSNKPQDFENATYDLSIAKNYLYSMESATLKNGRAENRYEITGIGEVVESLFFVDSVIGRLNGIDNVPVGILAFNGGGTGVFYTLWVFEKNNGTLKGIAFALLGDRTPIHLLAIKENQIVVVMTDRLPATPYCCTWEPQILYFDYINQQLVLSEMQRFGLSDERE